MSDVKATMKTLEQEPLLSRLSGALSGSIKPLLLLLFIYFTISALVRLALPNGLTLDEAEQALFSQYWLAGYGPQPPFYNWVQNAFVSLMGISMFSLVLPKFLMLFLAFLFYAMAARELDLKPAFAATATLGLMTLPQISYMPQQDLTHTAALLVASALFLYGVLRTLNRPDWKGYVLVGVAIGIGTLSKYNFILLPLATVLIVIVNHDWRQRLFDRRLLLTAAISIALVLPHGLWLIYNLDLATGGTLGKMVEVNAPQGFFRIIRALGSLALACLAFAALSVVIFAMTHRNDFTKALRAADQWTRLLGQIMLVSLVGVILVILFTGTTKITERWLDPYLLALPLYITWKLKKAGVDLTLSLHKLMPVFIGIMLIVLVPLPAKTLSGGLTGSYTRLNLPFAALADIIKADGKPTLIIAKGMHLAGNMRMQFPDVPVIDAELPVAGFPPDGTVKGAILTVWLAEGDAPVVPAFTEGASSSASFVQQVARPYVFGRADKVLTLAYTWQR